MGKTLTKRKLKGKGTRLAEMIDLPKPRGQTRRITTKENDRREKERSRMAVIEEGKSSRDIEPIDFSTINWKRRLACKKDLERFCLEYLPNVFYLSMAEDHKQCIKKMTTIVRDGGKFSLSMPRGGGKTAICRASIIWATAYAYRRFPFFIGSMQNKATQTLNFIKAYWYRSKELKEDFPEVAYPIACLENRWHLAKGQLFHGELTHIEWASDTVRYPSLLFTEEEASIFLKKDPESLRYVKEYDCHIPKTSGIVIRTAGIDGSIRGEAEVNPLTLEQPRPDLVLLDDIQKDQKADSPAACEKLVRLVDGAIQGLSGPGKQISAIMPCTIIREGDVSDTYLDRLKKPEWKGERFPMVISWPAGITDEEITDDTTAGRLWTKYAELLHQSYRMYEDARLANKHYKKHRRTMDRGFKVSWKDRYDKDRELSPQQHAMNLRFSAPEAFLPEYQSKGRKITKDGPPILTAGQLAEKSISLTRRTLPVDCQHISAFIDLQNEVFFYVILAVSSDFTGCVVDYGTFPEIKTHHFTKGQTEGWSLLTKAFFQKYPKYRDTATKTKGMGPRAPLEAKIYHALSLAVPAILGLELIRQDGHQTVMHVQRLAIDTRWGSASDVTKRFIRESGYRELVPYYGQSFSPTHKQLEEYTLTKGWWFEHQAHPQVKNSKWVYRANPDGMFYLSADVNRLKDFLFERLASPPGSPGSISLFRGTPERHQLFCNHICSSEYPEPVTARGMTKNQWKAREGRPDNDYLDCLVGCIALASMLGACLQVASSPSTKSRPSPRRGRRKISDRWRKRRR